MTISDIAWCIGVYANILGDLELEWALERFQHIDEMTSYHWSVLT